MNTANDTKELVDRFESALRTQIELLVKAIQPTLSDPPGVVEEIKRQVERKKRHWTSEQKIRILQEARAARAREWGSVRRVCEKYRITSAHLTQWKHQLAG